jgi:hypothetical protein
VTTETTEDKALDVPFWKSEKQQPSHFRRHWLLYIIASIAFISTLIIGALKWNEVQREDSADGAARDSMVAIRAQEAETKFHGGLIVQSYSDATKYSWNSNTHTVSVRVRLGFCDGINGYFANVPTRPTSTDGVSILILAVPSANQYVSQEAKVPVDAPNLYSVLAASAYAHCIKDDMRFFPPPFPVD